LREKIGHANPKEKGAVKDLIVEVFDLAVSKDFANLESANLLLPDESGNSAHLRTVRFPAETWLSRINSTL
jgi:hypothetical protein